MSKLVASSSFHILFIFLFLINIFQSHCKNFFKRLQQQDEKTAILTSTLLKDILHNREITKISCSFNLIYLNQSSSFSDGPFINPELISSLNEPYSQITNRVEITGNFKSSCWTNVIFFRHFTANQEALQILSKFSHTIYIYDQLVFISPSEYSMRQFLFNDNIKIINVAARKYAMFLIEGNSTKIGYYVEPISFTGNFMSSNAITFTQKLKNLNGRTLVAAYIPFKPYVVMWKGKGSENEALSGVQISLLQEISARENVTFIYNGNLKTSGFGNLFPNGSWTGLVGELVDGSAELTPALAATLQRQPILGFTTPAYAAPIVFCIKAPKEGRQWEALVYPLSTLVWSLTLITFLIFVFLFVFKFKIERNAYPEYSSGTLKFILMVSLRLYTILLDQPSPAPKRNISKFIIFLWIFFCYMIGQAYKANLVGFLTFTEKQSIPTSFQDLHQNLKYQIILQTIGGMELELFRTSPSPVMKGIAGRMTLDKNILSCLLKAGENEMTICIAWKDSITTAIATYSNQYKQLKSLNIADKESGVEIHCSFATKKNSIFQETLIRYLGWARATSLIGYWRELVIREIEKEAKKGNKGMNGGDMRHYEQFSMERPLAKGDLFIVFFTIGIGVAVSISVFVGEFINFKRNLKL